MTVPTAAATLDAWVTGITLAVLSAVVGVGAKELVSRWLPRKEHKQTGNTTTINIVNSTVGSVIVNNVLEPDSPPAPQPAPPTSAPREESRPPRRPASKPEANTRAPQKGERTPGEVIAGLVVAAVVLAAFRVWIGAVLPAVLMVLASASIGAALGARQLVDPASRRSTYWRKRFWLVVAISATVWACGLLLAANLIDHEGIMYAFAVGEVSPLSVFLEVGTSTGILLISQLVGAVLAVALALFSLVLAGTVAYAFSGPTPGKIGRHIAVVALWVNKLLPFSLFACVTSLVLCSGLLISTAELISPQTGETPFRMYTKPAHRSGGVAVRIATNMPARGILVLRREDRKSASRKVSVPTGVSTRFLKASLQRCDSQTCELTLRLRTIDGRVSSQSEVIDEAGLGPMR